MAQRHLPGQSQAVLPRSATLCGGPGTTGPTITWARLTSGCRLPLRCGSARTRSGSRTGATMTTTSSKTSASRTVVILGISVGGTVSDGHGHDLDDVRLTLYHDAGPRPWRRPSPAPTAPTSSRSTTSRWQEVPGHGRAGERGPQAGNQGEGDRGVLLQGVHLRHRGDRGPARHRLQQGATLHGEPDKGDVENCASVWHYLQLNRQVARSRQGPHFDAHGQRLHKRGGRDGGFYRQAEKAIYLGSHVVDDDSHAGGAPDDAYPPPGSSARTARPTSTATR